MAYPDTALSSTAWTGIPRPAAPDMQANVTDPLNAARSALHTTPQNLLLLPGSSLDANSNGTWLTLGSVTVPTWATSAVIIYTINGVYDTGTTANMSMQIKIGSAAGAINKRIHSPGVASQRFSATVVDEVASLATGAQSVTVSIAWTAGTIRADTTSYATACLFFGA